MSPHQKIWYFLGIFIQRQSASLIESGEIILQVSQMSSGGTNKSHFDKITRHIWNTKFLKKSLTSFTGLVPMHFCTKYRNYLNILIYHNYFWESDNLVFLKIWEISYLCWTVTGSSEYRKLNKRRWLSNFLKHFCWSLVLIRWIISCPKKVLFGDWWEYVIECKFGTYVTS